MATNTATGTLVPITDIAALSLIPGFKGPAVYLDVVDATVYRTHGATGEVAVRAVVVAIR